MLKSKKIIEFGDFQTPQQLAERIINCINLPQEYEKIIEPTCGLGAFLRACVRSGIDFSKLEGWEINPIYVHYANNSLNEYFENFQEIVKEQDFFQVNWSYIKKYYTKPILFIGNPPWVTNSELGRLLSKNIPEKYNFQGLNGLSALTGKSNFDISEWILIQLLNFISKSSSAIAFLIKRSVARKLFEYIVRESLFVSDISLKEIDAKKYFDVNVDACLFQARGTKVQKNEYLCPVFKELEDTTPYKTMGIVEGKLVANIIAYRNIEHIDRGSEFKWRSGIKHDASKIMEFSFDGEKLKNGLNEIPNLPFDYLYPMYKSSNISKREIKAPSRYMLIPQKKIGEDTKLIETFSSQTWDYLCAHSAKLDSRKSSIYRNSPRFSVFGVGKYTFLPWKIVISGLYKNIKFSKIGQFNGKPIVVDDTCYMLGFEYEEQAEFALKLLNSKKCREFINAIIFIDNKRPITVALLNRISLRELAKELGVLKQYNHIFYTLNKCDRKSGDVL